MNRRSNKKNNFSFWIKVFLLLLSLNLIILLFYYWNSFEVEFSDDSKPFIEYMNINIPDYPTYNYSWRDCAPVMCDLESERCLSSSSTLPISSKKLPCCSQLLEMILIDWKKIFNSETHVQYFLFYGTLLGAIRNESIIRGTLDVDVVIRPSTLEYLTSERSKKMLWKHGYLIFEENEMGRVCFARHIRNGLLRKWFSNRDFYQNNDDFNFNYIDYHPYMDLYTEHLEKNNHTNKNEAKSVLKFKNGPCEFPSAWIYPLSQVFINGKQYPAPKKSLGVVEYLYGSNWRIPMENKHGKIHECHGIELNL